MVEFVWSHTPDKAREAPCRAPEDRHRQTNMLQVVLAPSHFFPINTVAADTETTATRYAVTSLSTLRGMQRGLKPEAMPLRTRILLPLKAVTLYKFISPKRSAVVRNICGWVRQAHAHHAPGMPHRAPSPVPPGNIIRRPTSRRQPGLWKRCSLDLFRCTRVIVDNLQVRFREANPYWALRLGISSLKMLHQHSPENPTLMETGTGSYTMDASHKYDNL